MTVKITTPLTDQVVESLKIGDEISMSGKLYTARDAAHKRLVELMDKGEKLPIELEGQVIYFVGPTPAPPGRAIGSAGPTTSYRMDSYSPRLIERGLKGMIGKGERGEVVVEAMKKHKAVYFAAIGGAGALLSQRIISAKVVAYEDLGAEAIREIEVVDFPMIVAQDCHGGNLYQKGVAEYRIA